MEERRLIDANALDEQFEKRIEWLLLEVHDKYSLGIYHGAATDKDLIGEMPTVDAVPVVRCRECKYLGDEDGKLQNSDGVLFARCKVHNYLLDGRHTGWCPTENDFCSYGERKEGAYNEP